MTESPCTETRMGLMAILSIPASCLVDTKGVYGELDSRHLAGVCALRSSLLCSETRLKSDKIGFLQLWLAVTSQRESRRVTQSLHTKGLDRLFRTITCSACAASAMYQSSAELPQLLRWPRTAPRRAKTEFPRRGSRAEPMLQNYSVGTNISS